MNKSQILEMPFFYDRYIDLISNELTIVDALVESANVLEAIKDDLIRFQKTKYKEGKWTPKDILQHIVDTERIMSYRALVLARGEQQVLIGYEEDKFAENTNANKRTVEDLLEEFSLLRATTIYQFKHFSEEMLLKTGTCSGIHVSPLIFGFVCVGHIKHHISVLQERYFIK